MKCTRRNFLLASIGLPLTAPLLTSAASLSVDLHPTIKDTNSSSVDLLLLLRCIAEVETGNDDTKVGPKGERSRYQITEAVYRQHFGFPVYSACSEFSHRTFCVGDVAHDCALRHVRWLDSTIPRLSPMERDWREYVLAWAWHGGRDSWIRNLNPHKNNNYAVRVTNLYNVYRDGTKLLPKG